jgi:hypothetical protein
MNRAKAKEKICAAPLPFEGQGVLDSNKEAGFLDLAGAATPRDVFGLPRSG